MPENQNSNPNGGKNGGEEDNKFFWVVMAFVALFLYLFEPTADACGPDLQPERPEYASVQLAEGTASIRGFALEFDIPSD